MPLMVQKFGGSSVCDAAHLRRAAHIAAQAQAQGYQVVVVVSAQGDTTDELLARAHQISSRVSRRELDMLLSAGEQMSAALMAMTLQQLGCSAVSLTGWQAGFVTDCAYGKACIRDVELARLQNELARQRIVVVAGFQGLSRSDDITTLGRGGSDTSAVALAAALRADICRIYTDVDGVYTADPHCVPNARLLQEIGFEEMLALASMGAQVLHVRSVELAKKYAVPLEVRSSMTNAPGTQIKEGAGTKGMLIKGVAKDENVALVSVLRVLNRPSVSFQLLRLLAQHEIHAGMILQSAGCDAAKDILCTVPKSQVMQVQQLLHQHLTDFSPEQVKVDTDVAKVSVVGAGLQSNMAAAAQLFKALHDHQIQIQMLSCAEIKMSVIIHKKDADRAVAAVHTAFFA